MRGHDAFRKECLNHHIVSNNVETIEEYDRMVGIEIPDNLKQNLIKKSNSSFKYITYALVKEKRRCD